MRAWAFLLGGLLVWAVHFFGIYITASVFLDTTLSRVLSAALTALCLLADAWLFRLGLPRWRAELDGVTRWRLSLGLLGAALSFLSMLWQGLPALLV